MHQIRKKKTSRCLRQRFYVMSESLLAVPTISSGSSGSFATRSGTTYLNGRGGSTTITVPGPILLAYAVTDDSDMQGCGNGILAGPDSTVSGSDSNDVGIYSSVSVSNISCVIKNLTQYNRRFLYTIIYMT